MQIGMVAKRIGLSVDAIRFYERNGLLPRPRDYIAVYKPDQLWIDGSLQPEFTGRPVVRFIDGARKALQTMYSGKEN